MRVTRTIHAPVDDGWIQPRFIPTAEYPTPIYWQPTDRVIIINGECDHGEPFVIRVTSHAELVAYTADLDCYLMHQVIAWIDCSSHARP